ncbi:MAG: diacylglycerol kinase family protein [Treponemataceae bacterium]
MSVLEFAADFATLVSRSAIAPGRPLRWTIIANPSAGGFTIRSRWNKHRETLRAHAENALRKPARAGGAAPSLTARELDSGDGGLGALGLIATTGPKHAGEIVRALLDEVAAETPDATTGALPLHLLATAGGDGTSLEALTVLFEAAPALRSRFAVLRLPMGTGNDGADFRELSDALDLVAEPSRIEFGRAVTLSTSTSGKGPFIAFNILSIGLDAFVTHMTNRMKGKMPGDSYKLWVDIATLFYDKVYAVEPMTVVPYDQNGHALTAFTDRLLLLAFGASGHRTYGSNKLILPNDHNVCAVSQMPLLKKISLKPLLLSGKHAELPDVRLFTTPRVDISYNQPILAQMDGESVLIEPGDFPISIALSEPAIPALKAI